VSDASAVAEVLRLKYGFEVQLLINATRQQILKAMNQYRANLTEQDNLLIYYAGHGYLDRESNTGFWQPVDAEAEDDINWIANDDLTRRFNAMNVRHVMVVADSCYSGTLVRSSSANLPTAAEREPWLRRMSERRSRTAIVSGGLEPVADTGRGGHSVFANAFLGMLRESTDVLDGQALAQGVTQKVVLNADQTPQYSDIRKAGHEGGEFLFVPKGSALAAAPAAAAPQPQASGTDAKTIELALWNAAKDSTSPAAFEVYLEQYPSGIFAKIARLKIDELKAGAKKATPPAKTETKTALVAPPAPVVDVEEVDETFVTVKNVNLRARPTTKSKKVATLKKGAEVPVTGKVKNGKWYRIEHAGADAYAYAPLLQEKSAWEEAKATTAQEARRQADLAAERRAKDEERRRVEEEAQRIAAARRQAQEAEAAKGKSETTASLLAPAKPSTGLKPIAVGTEVAYRCTGPYFKSLVWRVTSISNGMVRLDGTSDGKPVWLEKPAYLLSTTLFHRQDSADGNGVTSQSFDRNDFRSLRKPIPGTELEGDVTETRGVNSWTWSYTITVGDPEMVELPTVGKVKVVPLVESRWDYNGTYSSELISYHQPELSFPIAFVYDDNKGSLVCKLSSLKQR
jgi:uncharacterized protein YgiM (DUF1202 family)